MRGPDRLQSAFTERLAQAGFDADYEPTDEGVLLEELMTPSPAD